MSLVAEDAQAQLVGAVEGLRVQVLGFLRLRQVHDLHMGRARKVPRQAGMQLFSGGTCGQLAQMERDGEHDSLAERSIRREEKRPVRQPGMQGDFRGVLVLQPQAVDLERRGAGGPRALVFFHAGASTA